MKSIAETGKQSLYRLLDFKVTLSGPNQYAGKAVELRADTA